VRSERACLTQHQRELAAASQRLVRVLRAPPSQQATLERVHARWQRTAEKRLGALKQHLAHLGLALKHLGPQAVLDRGYSIILTETGSVVQDASQLAAGDEVTLHLARGAADATVRRTRTE
jgi:exodeoxyribonuclease VII large subunit